MEEDEPMECGSEVHPCPEQIDSLSLIISVEEEETQRHSDSGLHSAGEDGGTNGHGTDDGEDPAAPLCSPGTSYWRVTEGADFPFLLSPAAKPAEPGEQAAAGARSERASRPGLSRIPGRDHRRYYHEYWRSEYLMDFDPRRHGMVCMVCGSALATLKLSTIKRHIRQKHPDSLLWSAADKDVIRSGWESHLGPEGGRWRPSCAAGGGAGGGAGPGQYQVLHCARRSTAKPAVPATPKRQPSLVGGGGVTAASPCASPCASPGGSARTLERYLNDSLHAWFRQEFLMEYEAGRGRLLCMVCGSQLPSLHLDHIKRHVLDVHPNSLVYSAEEKHCILQTWAQRQEYNPLRSSTPVKSEPWTEDGGTRTDGFLTAEPQNPGTVKGRGPGRGTGAQNRGPRPHGPSRGRSPRAPLPQRWRLEYLVARGPGGRGLCCVVCSEPLPVGRVSSFRQHTLERHPEAAGLSRQERQELADAWDREATPPLHLPHPPPPPPPGGEVLQTQEEATPNAPATLAVAARGGRTGPPHGTAERNAGDGTEEGGGGGGGVAAREGATAGRHGHYPGKDQRRNYQARWRMEYLMDYDCRRHGLVCMVCGSALATLKVSTIKRHIRQVHPDSLAYGAAERQLVVLIYNQTALRFVHSDGCFATAADHGHAGHPDDAAAAPSPAPAGLFPTWGAGTPPPTPRHPLPSGSKSAGLSRLERRALADAWDREAARPPPHPPEPPPEPSGGGVLEPSLRPDHVKSAKNAWWEGEGLDVP
ncbi:zinc finger translocation-associated protein [Anguilla rostrata]|uniref:zinc finger translocation-associated protein n=1 Tax=Anguilla rostrata TaxID=7938 RepID=UPI0030D386CD